MSKYVGLGTFVKEKQVSPITGTKAVVKSGKATRMFKKYYPQLDQELWSYRLECGHEAPAVDFE